MRICTRALIFALLVHICTRALIFALLVCICTRRSVAHLHMSWSSAPYCKGMAVTNSQWHRFSRWKGQGCKRALWVESIKSYWGGKISSWCAYPSKKVNTAILMILTMAPTGDLYVTMRYCWPSARFPLRTFGLFWLSRWPKTKDKHLSQVDQVARWRLFLDVRDTEEQCPPLSSCYHVGREGSTLCWLDGHLGEGRGVNFGQWPIPCRQAPVCYIHGHWTGNRRTDWVFSSMAATQ